MTSPSDSTDKVRQVCKFKGCYGTTEGGDWCGVHERTQLSKSQSRAARREMDMTQNQRDRLYMKRAARSKKCL
jgi:hypothetical protein